MKKVFSLLILCFMFISCVIRGVQPNYELAYTMDDSLIVQRMHISSSRVLDKDFNHSYICTLREVNAAIESKDELNYIKLVKAYSQYSFDDEESFIKIESVVCCSSSKLKIKYFKKIYGYD